MTTTSRILEVISPYLEPILQAIRQDNVSPDKFFWSKASIVDYCEIQSFEVEYREDDLPDYIFFDRSTAIIDIKCSPF